MTEQKIKITKQGTRTIKRLITLTVLTMLSVNFLPQGLAALVYPALMLALIFLLPIFHKYRKTPDFSFFGNLCLAAIFVAAFFLLLPFTEEIGSIGFGVIAFVYVFLAMASEKIMGSDIDATLMTLIFLVLVNFFDISMPITRMVPAFLAAAVLLDLTRHGFPVWVRGLFAGLVWSAILLGFSYQDPFEMSMAVTFASAAGLVAGSLFSLFHLDDEKHIEKLLKKW